MEQFGADLGALNDAFTDKLLQLLDGIKDGVVDQISVDDDLARARDIAALAGQVEAQTKTMDSNRYINFETFQLDGEFMQSSDYGCQSVFNASFDLGELLTDETVAGHVLFAGLQRYDTDFFGVDAVDISPNFHEAIKLDGLANELTPEGVRVRLFNCSHINSCQTSTCALCRATGHRELVLVQ